MVVLQESTRTSAPTLSSPLMSKANNWGAARSAPPAPPIWTCCDGPNGSANAADWAVEDCRHLSRRLERDLLAAGEVIVRLPPKLMAKVRDSARTFGRSDPIDALVVARAGPREPHLPAARLDEPEREVRLGHDIPTVVSPPGHGQGHDLSTGLERVQRSSFSAHLLATTRQPSRTATAQPSLED